MKAVKKIVNGCVFKLTDCSGSSFADNRQSGSGEFRCGKDRRWTEWNVGRSGVVTYIARGYVPNLAVETMRKLVAGYC